MLDFPLKGRLQLTLLLLLTLVASKTHSAPSVAAEALPRFAVIPVDKAAPGAGANATDHNIVPNQSASRRLAGMTCTVQVDCDLWSNMQNQKASLAVSSARTAMRRLLNLFELSVGS